MTTIEGKYNKAVVLTSNLEEECRKQINKLLDQKFVEGSNIAIMPDTHAGCGCVIGFTQTITDKVVPNLVGVDIGCGMEVMKIRKEVGDKLFDQEGLKKLDSVIRERIPIGSKHRETKHSFTEWVHVDQLIARVKVEESYYSIGSLGGGNHFIEVDKDENGDYYIVIHSGSRHLGLEVCKHYQTKAVRYHANGIDVRNELIEKLKAEGRANEIAAELAKLPMKEKVPDELAYLEGKDKDDYIHDMKLTQEYAVWNRKAMMHEIVEGMGIKEGIVGGFCTVHNYIDTDAMILRKGAISLKKDEIAIIPINMAYGSLIVRGKGNEKYNCSGPHGAGRLMSRTIAKEKLKMEEFKEVMKGIFTTSVSEGTIDEAPMVYKPPEEILKNIDELCDVLDVIKPIYNLKASDNEQ